MVILTGYLLMLVETTIESLFWIGPVRPDGLIVLVVWCGLTTPLPNGLAAILGLGLFAEAFSAASRGLYIFSFAAGYLMVRYILSHVITPYLWQRMLLVTVVSMICLTILLVGTGGADLVWPWGALQAILNGILSPAFFFVFDKIKAYSDRLVPINRKRGG